MRNMLDYQKFVLTRVSDNRELFKKELFKSFKWLHPFDIPKLYSWVKNKYYAQYREEIEDVFNAQHAAA